MDGELVLTAERLVVHLPGVCVVLPIAVADLSLLDDAIEEQRFQLLQDVCGLDLGVLYLFFDILLFVGEVLISVTAALDVGLLLKEVQRRFQPLALGG